MLWGIDLGGTKIEGAILRSGSSAETVVRERIATEADGGYDHILGRIKSLISILEEKAEQKAERIGFGTPGVLDPKTQTLKNSNTLCLNSKPLKRDLEKLLGAEVAIANDANCFTLAESKCGAGRGAATVFGVILGTGVGGGVYVNGQVLHGCQGIAGEWGHNILEPEGESCYCGKRGCVERVISGPALQSFYKSRAGKSERLDKIALLAKEGDVAAKETIDRLCQGFGRAISVVINILDPDVIVLGGGVSNISDLYSAGIQATSGFVMNNELNTKIIRNMLGDSAGVIGAALLCEKGVNSQ